MTRERFHLLSIRSFNQHFKNVHCVPGMYLEFPRSHLGHRNACNLVFHLQQPGKVPATQPRRKPPEPGQLEAGPENVQFFFSLKINLLFNINLIFDLHGNEGEYFKNGLRKLAVWF